MDLTGAELVALGVRTAAGCMVMGLAGCLFGSFQAVCDRLFSGDDGDACDGAGVPGQYPTSRPARLVENQLKSM